MHGHTYLYKLTFEFNEMEEIGYAIDFKEIKRVGCQWIDDILDHGFLVNPKDTAVIDACKTTGSKIWYMGLNGKDEYCNPSVENISKEIFLAMMVLFEPYGKTLFIKEVEIYETPNCGTTCTKESIASEEAQKWMNINYETVSAYAKDKGVFQYDDRKI
jgi:6-pyruvoyltetrahydropterin/6-carboxytetrahydropterin synthase